MVQNVSPRAGAPEPTDEELAVAIAETCRELRTLGSGPRFETIHYLLDEIRIQTNQFVRPVEDERSM